MFPAKEEPDAWSAKRITGYECEREHPREPLGAYHFTDKDDNSHAVCRIEFVLLGEGTYQFNIWSSERRLHSEVGHVGDLGGHLRLTARFLDIECEGDFDWLESILRRACPLGGDVAAERIGQSTEYVPLLHHLAECGRNRPAGLRLSASVRRPQHQ